MRPIVGKSLSNAGIHARFLTSAHAEQVPFFGVLKRAQKLFYADARLTKDALDSANRQVAVRRHRYAPASSDQTNVGASLPLDRKA
jgi:hypothetical protein